MKTGRRDSLESHALEVEAHIPNFNDSMSFVLSRFQQIGVDTQAAVALFGNYYYIIFTFYFLLFYLLLTTMQGRS